jgi:hypothetical protein
MVTGTTVEQEPAAGPGGVRSPSATDRDAGRSTGPAVKVRGRFPNERAREIVPLLRTTEGVIECEW